MPRPPGWNEKTRPGTLPWMPPRRRRRLPLPPLLGPRRNRLPPVGPVSTAPRSDRWPRGLGIRWWRVRGIGILKPRAHVPRPRRVRAAPRHPRRPHPPYVGEHAADAAHAIQFAHAALDAYRTLEVEEREKVTPRREGARSAASSPSGANRQRVVGAFTVVECQHFGHRLDKIRTARLLERVGHLRVRRPDRARRVHRTRVRVLVVTTMDASPTRLSVSQPSGTATPQAPPTATGHPTAIGSSTTRTPSGGPRLRRPEKRVRIPDWVTVKAAAALVGKITPHDLRVDREQPFTTRRNGGAYRGSVESGGPDRTHREAGSASWHTDAPLPPTSMRSMKIFGLGNNKQSAQQPAQQPPSATVEQQVSSRTRGGVHGRPGRQRSCHGP